MHSIAVKFGMHIIGRNPTYCIEFREFRIKCFFTGAQKRFFIHYSLWSQIIKNMLVSILCFRLNWNLICSLWITFPRTLLILEGAGGLVFLQGTQNVIHYGLQAQNFWGRFSIYLNLFKINLWHIPFIIYGRHWKLCA